MNILILFAIYLVGVIISLVIIAWLNTRPSFRNDEIPACICGLSWIAFATVIIFLLIRPFEDLYKFMYKMFSHGNYKERW